MSSVSNFPSEVQTTFNRINFPIGQLPEHAWEETRLDPSDRLAYHVATIKFPKAGPSITRISLGREQGIAFQITARKTHAIGIVVLIPPPPGVSSAWLISHEESLAAYEIDGAIESDVSGWIRRIVEGTDEKFQLVVPFPSQSFGPSVVPTVVAAPAPESPLLESVEPEAVLERRSSAGSGRAPADVGFARAGGGAGSGELARSTSLPPSTLRQRILASIASLAGAIWRLLASLFSGLSSCLPRSCLPRLRKV